VHGGHLQGAADQFGKWDVSELNFDIRVGRLEILLDIGQTFELARDVEVMDDFNRGFRSRGTKADKDGATNQKSPPERKCSRGWF
jgi:hypothetical protein